MKDFSVQDFLATHTKNLKSSAIRELLKATSQPGMRSFASGSPAPEALPLAYIKEHSPRILETLGNSLLQYGITEGYAPLREVLNKNLLERGISCASASGPYISPGAQAAIDSCAKALIDAGDRVFVEAPTFLASLKTFRAYGATLVQLEMDDEGILPDALAAQCAVQAPKFLYVIPNFHNPSGRTTSLARRNAIVELARKWNFLILEDDAYYDLRFSGEALPPIAALAPERTLYAGSLSKCFSPGMRLGFYEGPEALCATMTSLRQGADVHANLLAQALAADFLAHPGYKGHLQKIRGIYLEKWKLMDAALATHFSKLAHWTRPSGGMFCWLDFLNPIDILSLQQAALQAKIAFVPGFHFFVDESFGRNSLRLNFSNPSIHDIPVAVAELAELAKTIQKA